MLIEVITDPPYVAIGNLYLRNKKQNWYAILPHVYRQGELGGGGGGWSWNSFPPKDFETKTS